MVGGSASLIFNYIYICAHRAKKQQLNKDACLHRQCMYQGIPRTKPTNKHEKRKKRIRNSTEFLRNTTGSPQGIPKEFSGIWGSVQNSNGIARNSVGIPQIFLRDSEVFPKDFHMISEAIAREFRFIFFMNS